MEQTGVSATVPLSDLAPFCASSFALSYVLAVRFRSLMFTQDRAVGD